MMDLTLSRQQKLAYGAIGILAVIFAGIMIYLQIAGGPRSQGPVPSPTEVDGLRPEVASQGFDVDVLQDPRYQDLDRSLFTSGRLPVPAPANPGRPNLF